MGTEKYVEGKLGTACKNLVTELTDKDVDSLKPEEVTALKDLQEKLAGLLARTLTV